MRREDLREHALLADLPASARFVKGQEPAFTTKIITADDGTSNRSS